MDMDDEGRPVKPHRSGRSYRLALAAALAVAGLAISTGRRAEKDNAALAKAEAKRQRKAAKRLLKGQP